MSADGDDEILLLWRLVRATTPAVVTGAGPGDGDDDPGGALFNMIFIRVPVLLCFAALLVNVLLGGGVSFAQIDWPPQTAIPTAADALLRLRGGVTSAPSARLWSRPQALATLHHPTLLRLGVGSLRRDGLAQLAIDERTVERGLRRCLREASRSIMEATSSAEDGRWVAGRWKASAPAGAARAAGRLAALAEEIDETAPQLEEPPRRVENVEESEAAAALCSHLRSAIGPFAQLGAAAPVLRTMGWAHTALLTAGLDGGGADAPCGAWIREHAVKWGALAGACDDAFDGACAALDGGASALSLGGALSDVECAVALREAMTSGSLLYEMMDAASAADSAADPNDGDGVWVGRAHAQLEAVEPGWRPEELELVTGVGLRNAEGQQAARKAAAESWAQASGRGSSIE